MALRAFVCASLLCTTLVVAKPQDFDFNSLAGVANPFVVQAQPVSEGRQQGRPASSSGGKPGQPEGSAAAILENVETCPNFETPFHTISKCRGVSEVVHDGSCDNKITWSKGSLCDAECEIGYGFFEQPSPRYSCDQGGKWSPSGRAPECYEIVPVYSANLQFKIVYGRSSIESLQHQFDGLVYKYNDIFCPYPEECGIGDIQIKSALDDDGRKNSEVIITIDTPVYNITDQAGFTDLVREAVFTVTEDNAFMTLIDYDNIELVLPIKNDRNFKAEPMLCCHTCPEGHSYRLGNCVRCPNPDCGGV